ncbi:MAG TPA: tripartite tricarboxylate transporter substrate binding protein, partial [Devosia sp.]|nr:tripartite tricarboxylate transporter substrate binding protein [Devosia sp.]
ADELGKATGQRFLVDNRPGAAGAIGTKAGIASDPDGYTLLMGVASTIAINPHTLVGDAGYDPIKDLRAVAVVAYTPWVLVGSAKLPFDDATKMLDYGKAHPDELTFGTWTATGEMGRKILELRSGVKLLPVPYDGAVAALNDLVAGRASVAMTDLSTAVPFIESGDINLLAVTGPERSNLMPDTPAISESGISNMDVNSWNVLFVPANTPDEIVNKLNELTNSILDTPEMRKKLAGLGADVYVYTPQQAADFVKTQNEAWGKVIAETTAP